MRDWGAFLAPQVCKPGAFMCSNTSAVPSFPPPTFHPRL
jgi:hypothetical protein